MSKKTKLRIIAVASDVAAFLALVAAVPYELGELATIISPELKGWIAGIGATAALLLRLLKRFLPPSDTADKQGN